MYIYTHGKIEFDSIVGRQLTEKRIAIESVSTKIRKLIFMDYVRELIYHREI